MRVVTRELLDSRELAAPFRTVNLAYRGVDYQKLQDLDAVHCPRMQAEIFQVLV